MSWESTSSLVNRRSPESEPRPGELALFISVNLKIINQVGYVGDVNYNPTLE
jgi:hypothetical protein